RAGLCPAVARPDRAPPRPDPAVRRSGRPLAGRFSEWSVVRGPWSVAEPPRPGPGRGTAARPGLPPRRLDLRIGVLGPPVGRVEWDRGEARRGRLTAGGQPPGSARPRHHRPRPGRIRPG